MKKYVIAVISVFLGFLLQSGVLSRISPAHVVPNILIIMTACFGFMDGELAGIVTGFLCGMLMDVFFGSFKGFYALIYMYMGYLNGRFHNIFYPEDIKLPLALIISTDLVYGLCCYIFLFLLRGRFNLRFYFGHVIFPEVIMTIIATLLVYPIILFLHNRFINRGVA